MNILTPLPTKVQTTSSFIYASGYAATVQPTSRTSFTTTLYSDPSFSWCFSDVSFDSQSVAHIAALIQSGEVLAVSDGSYKDGAGFPSWILESKDRTIWIKLTVICPGVSTAHSSYRSELMGILSLFLTVDKITSYYQVPFGNIEVACDGDSALKAAFCHRLSLKMDDPDSDLISAIHFHRQKSRISWRYVHIRGHQDTHQRIDQLPWVAQLNVEMDTNAKNRIKDTLRHPHQSPIPGEAWSLWIDDTKITGNMTNILYDHVHRQDVTDYWEAKPDIHTPFSAAADWEAVGLAMRASPLACRTFIVKHTAGMCGVGKFMKRWGEREFDTCPRCDIPEDACHVWKCHGNDADNVWANLE